MLVGFVALGRRRCPGLSAVWWLGRASLEWIVVELGHLVVAGEVAHGRSALLGRRRCPGLFAVSRLGRESLEWIVVELGLFVVAGREVAHRRSDLLGRRRCLDSFPNWWKIIRILVISAHLVVHLGVPVMPGRPFVGVVFHCRADAVCWRSSFSANRWLGGGSFERVVIVSGLLLLVLIKVVRVITLFLRVKIVKSCSLLRRCKS